MKFFLPVLAALAITVLTGLVLFPVVNVIFDSFFHLYLFSKPPENSWKDDLIIWITLFFWIFISSGAGGIVCSLLSKDKEDFSILLFLVLSFLIGLVFSKGEILTDFEVAMFIPFISFIAGAFTGGIWGTRYKKKKKKLKDIAPFPPGSPSQ